MPKKATYHPPLGGIWNNLDNINATQCNELWHRVAQNKEIIKAALIDHNEPLTKIRILEAEIHNVLGGGAYKEPNKIRPGGIYFVDNENDRLQVVDAMPFLRDPIAVLPFMAPPWEIDGGDCRWLVRFADSSYRYSIKSDNREYSSEYWGCLGLSLLEGTLGFIIDMKI